MTSIHADFTFYHSVACHMFTTSKNNNNNNLINSTPQKLQSREKISQHSLLRRHETTKVQNMQYEQLISTAQVKTKGRNF